MKKLIPLFLVLMLVLSACGNGDRKSVESFSGETVATISNTRQSEQPDNQVPTDGSTQVSTATVTTKATRALTATPVGPEPTQSHTATRTPSGNTAPVVSQSPYPVGTEETKTQTKVSPTKETATATPVTPTISATATTVTTAPTNATTPQPSATFTPTPVPINWSGDWHIWFQSTTGKYVHSIMTLSVINDKVFGSANIDGTDYRFDGIIYEENKVSGEWHTTNRDVRFWWVPETANQFLGSWAERFGFCGDKVNAVQPENCMKLPTR